MRIIKIITWSLLWALAAGVVLAVAALLLMSWTLRDDYTDSWTAVVLGVGSTYIGLAVAALTFLISLFIQLKNLYVRVAIVAVIILGIALFLNNTLHPFTPSINADSIVLSDAPIHYCYQYPVDQIPKGTNINREGVDRELLIPAGSENCPLVWSQCGKYCEENYTCPETKARYSDIDTMYRFSERAGRARTNDEFASICFCSCGH